jgi:hypothetical protein
MQSDQPAATAGAGAFPEENSSPRNRRWWDQHRHSGVSGAHPAGQQSLLQPPL